jgi:DNA repair protein RecN (Recombination protein N)
VLDRLLVENLVVLRGAELEFAPGLNVITGETGAGKTMLTQAVRLVTGAKADALLVGPVGDEAYCEAAFTDPIPASLAEIADPDAELTLARRLRRDRPARALCSGRACSADQLAEAGAELISLTGQHAARQLADTHFQLDLLDRAAGLEPSRRELSELFRDWREQTRQRDNLRQQLANSDERAEWLRQEIALIAELDPQVGEEVRLAQERDRLRHTDSLRAASLQATHILDDGGVSEQLLPIISQLADAAEYDAALATVYQDIDDAHERLLDAARLARDLADGYEAAPGQLDELEARLSELQQLRRRLGVADLENVRQRADEFAHELHTLDRGDELLTSAEAAANQAEQRYQHAAQTLSRQRQRAAKKLSRQAEQHLHDLALPDACLLAEFEQSAPSPRGVDRLQLLLQANPGIAAAPLDRGASGGELARVNLALLLASAPAAGCFIFDEVDTGIGGATAHIVGAKLHQLAQSVQVIVVTHLAQIAVVADRHFLVAKDHGETQVQLLVDEHAREQEIARLIGADADDAQAAQQAADLVRQAAARHAY